MLPNELETAEVGVPLVAGAVGIGRVIPGFPKTRPLAFPPPNAPNDPVGGVSVKNGLDAGAYYR